MRFPKAALAGVLGAGVLTLPASLLAPPASATFAVGGSQAYLGYWNAGAAGCGTTSTTLDEEHHDLAPATGSYQYTLSGVQHFDGGPGDTVDFTEQVDSKVALVAAANGFAKIAVDSTSVVTTTVGNALDDCAPVRANAQASTTVSFTTTTPGWVLLTAGGSGTGGFETQVSINVWNGIGPSWYRGRTTNGSLGATVYLPAGTYSMILQATARSAAAAGTHRARLTASARFVKPGTALAASAGKAGKHVVLPATLTCSSRRASVRITKAAARRKQPIVLHVNGVERKRIAKPRARAVTLTGVPATGPVVVSAVTRYGSVRRTYAGCGE